MKPRAPRSAQSGFTLIELLVVIVIFAIFALLAYGGLDSVLKTRVRVQSALERTAALQKAYMRLRNDLQQLRNRPARDAYGDPQPPLRVESLGAVARVEFTRGGWRNPLYLPRASLERVSYRLDGKKFTRDSWRVLDQAQDSKPASAVLLEPVDDVSWRFLDAERNWHTTWPPDVAAGAPGQQAAAPTPVGVEVTIDSAEFGELKFLFRPGLEPANIPATVAAPAPGSGPPPGPEDPPKPPPPPDDE